MSQELRPSSDAVIAIVADATAAAGVTTAIAQATGLGQDAVITGTGADFAHDLEGGSADAGAGSRIGRWLTSLGQEREQYIEMGQAAREGQHVVIVNGVTDDAAKEAVIAALQQHDAERITYVGNWQNEEIL